MSTAVPTMELTDDLPVEAEAQAEGAVEEPTADAAPDETVEPQLVTDEERLLVEPDGTVPEFESDAVESEITDLPGNNLSNRPTRLSNRKPHQNWRDRCKTNSPKSAPRPKRPAQAALRVTAALHEGLSAAYDFALDAEASPEEYLRLVEAQGLKIQFRAPMAPVARMAFDGGVSMPQPSGQFEAVLAWALKAELPRGALLERIDQAGGIPELVGEFAQAPPET